MNLGGNVKLVRFSSTSSHYNWKQFNDSTCSMEQVLLQGKQAFPDVFQSDSVEFTALQHSATPREELLLMMQGMGRYQGIDGKSIGDLIVFDQQRRSLQITGALIPLLMRTPPKNIDFGRFVREFHTRRIIPELSDISTEMQRKKYFDWVYSTVMDSSKKSEHPRIHQYFDEVKAELLSRQKKGVISLPDADLSDLAVKRVADALLKQEMDQSLHAITERIIESCLASREYESLPLVSPVEAQTFIEAPQLGARTSYPDRFTVLMAGGPGSGKSITTESFALQLAQSTGYSLDELSLLTVDRKRTIYYDDDCVKGTPRKNIGTLTHDEAVITYNLSGHFLSHRMEHNKPVPNVFKEMCNIWPSWLDIGLKKDGTYLISISTREPHKAVEGVIQRGMESDDFVTPPEYVLSSYRSVSERFPQVIAENESKKIILSVVNNELAIERKFSKKEAAEKEVNNNPAVVVDCETNTIYVIDLPQYADFINHSQLNPKAAHEGELYEGADLSIHSSIARVIDPSKFGSAKIAFVRQDISSKSVKTLEQNVVAVVQNNTLEVLEQEHFNELCSNAPRHFEALNALTSESLRPTL